MLGYAGGAAWLAIAWVAMEPLKCMFPGPVEGFFADGPPRWRCALGVLTQGILVPALFALSWHHHGRSFETWVERSKTRAHSPAEHAFFAIFALLLLSDYVRP